MDQAAISAPPLDEPGPATDRLQAIDAARGFALLGIFFVNIQFFAEPFGSYMRQTPESSDPLTVFFFYFVKILCEGKFYPLFSMLFGMGLALQMHSVMSRGGNFYTMYVRRLAWLFFMGLCHALLLWYGDILFIYSIAGLVLMLCVRIPPRVLLGIGIGLVLFSAVLMGAFGALGAFGAKAAPLPASVAAASAPTTPDGAAAQPAPTDVTAPPAEPPADAQADPAAPAEAIEGPAAAEQPAPQNQPPFWRLIEGFENRTVTDPSTGVWPEAETEAYRNGPWLQSFLFRAMSWVMILIFGFFGFNWHIVGMFLIGAGLLRMGLFSRDGERWHSRLFLIGLVVGLPGSILSTMLPHLIGLTWYTAAASGVLLMICGPMVSLMYLMAFALLIRHGLAQPVTFVLSNVGRMALTVYLSETLISTFVFYHWGLAQFASWTRPERCAFVVSVYVGLCVFSMLWMRAFRFGPMEWLWRTVTYWRAQPMLRTRGGAGSRFDSTSQASS